MTQRDLPTLFSEVLEEDIELTLAQLCRTCQLPADQIVDLIDEGVIDPVGRDPSGWRFYGISVRRIRCVQRLRQDLGINMAGAALALDLLEELEQLRARLQRLDQ